MIISRSPVCALGLVALIGIKLSFKQTLTYLEDRKQLSEVERVNLLEKEVRQLSNAMTFKSLK